MSNHLSDQQQQQQQQQQSTTSLTTTGTPTHTPVTMNLVTYFGRVYTLYDALLLLEACRLNILPTIDRRLTTFERLRFIKPNCIFIWNETKSGMKRWTDGKLWSASKVIFGNFLQYREINKVTKKPEFNGLIKQSFSLNTKDGQRFHLISYYQLSNPNINRQRLMWNGTLPPVTNDDTINSINSDDDYGGDDGNDERILKKRKLLHSNPASAANSPTSDLEQQQQQQLEEDYEDGYIVCIPSHDPKLKKLTLSTDIYPSHTLRAIPKNLRTGLTGPIPNTPSSIKGEDEEDVAESSTSTPNPPIAPGAIGYNNLSSQQQKQQQQQKLIPLNQQVPTYTNLQDSLNNYSHQLPLAPPSVPPTIPPSTYPIPSTALTKTQYSPPPPPPPPPLQTTNNSATSNYATPTPATTNTTATTNNATPVFQFAQVSNLSTIPPASTTTSTSAGSNLHFKFNNSEYIKNCDLQIVDILNKGFLK